MIDAAVSHLKKSVQIVIGVTKRTRFRVFLNQIIYKHKSIVIKNDIDINEYNARHNKLQTPHRLVISAPKYWSQTVEQVVRHN